MTRPSEFRVGALLSGLALLVAACAPAASPTAPETGEAPPASPQPDATPAESPQETVAVTFLMDFLSSGWHAPAWAGVAQGFFADLGLDVTVEPGQGSVDGATKVAANAAQFAQIDSVSAMNAMAAGGDLLLIGVIDQAFPGGLCYIEERHTINDFGDLVGLRIGASEGDAYMVPLPGLMEEAGYTTDEYEHVVMTPPNYAGALSSDQIDAYACSRATFIPGSAAAGSEGLTLGMFRYADTGFQPIGHALVVNGEFARENADAVQRFVDAWATSNVWAYQNLEAAIDDFIASNPDVDRDIAMQTLVDRGESLTAGDEWFTFDPDKLAATVEFLNSAYGAELTPADVHTTEFVDALRAELRRGELP